MEVDTMHAVGIGSAISSVLSYVFYRKHRSRKETARHVRDIPVWHPDLELHDHLKKQDPSSLAYAAVEGVVKDMGSTLNSLYGPETGVIRRSKIIVHKSQLINGSWHDIKDTVKDKVEIVPFAVVKPGGDTKFKVEVTDPGIATQLQNELDTTYDRFEPHSSRIFRIGLNRLFNKVTHGVQETEQMLLTGTSVLGVGKIFLDRGNMKLSPPDDSSRSYIITKMRLSELVQHLESQSATFKVLAIVYALIGGGLLMILVWRNTRDWLEKRRHRMEFEEIRRSLAELRRHSISQQGSSTEQEHREEEEEERDENTCVVCLGNASQVISLPCRHLTMCVDCAEALLLPKKCPICRANVDRFIPVGVAHNV